MDKALKDDKVMSVLQVLLNILVVMGVCMVGVILYLILALLLPVLG